VSETLKESGRGASGGRQRAQGVFVAVEMALALVLLIGAGLMIRSLNALWNVDPGFRPDNVLTFSLSLPPAMRAVSPAAHAVALRDLSDKLNAMPGVKASSFLMGAAPLQGEDDVYFWFDDRPKPASTSEMPMQWYIASNPAISRRWALRSSRVAFLRRRMTNARSLSS
jgi:hypothetical protein